MVRLQEWGHFLHGEAAMRYVFLVVILTWASYPGNIELSAFFHVAPPTESMVTFEDRSLGIAIEYPNNWERSKISQDQVTFIAPRETDLPSFPAGLGIRSHDLSSFNATLDSLAREIITDLDRDSEDFILLSSGPTNLNDLNAYEIYFSATDDKEAKRTAMQLVVKPENLVYVITYKAYPELYESYMPIIQSMLESLKFLR